VRPTVVVDVDRRLAADHAEEGFQPGQELSRLGRILGLAFRGLGVDVKHGSASFQASTG
jgi:hypothetical protein